MKIEIKNFSGPLDLLLQLIQKEELNITELALSEITENFFEYLDKLDKSRESEMADFLVVATKLVYLKSKHLLPEVVVEEDENSLALQLKMYKKFVEASYKIEKLWSDDKKSYGRIEPPVKLKEFVLPSNAHQDDLHLSFENILKRLKPIDPLPQAMIDRGVNIKDRVANLKNILKKVKKLNFKDLLSNVHSRTEVIVNFLAVLDMVKAGEASIKQSDCFGNLEIFN